MKKVVVVCQARVKVIRLIKLVLEGTSVRKRHIGRVLESLLANFQHISATHQARISIEHSRTEKFEVFALDVQEVHHGVT